MKYIVTFDWQPNSEQRTAGIERFKRDGGRMPKGVKLVGRWTKADLSGGFVLLETDDPQAPASFSYGWSDLMVLNTASVLDDPTSPPSSSKLESDRFGGSLGLETRPVRHRPHPECS